MPKSKGNTKKRQQGQSASLPNLPQRISAKVAEQGGLVYETDRGLKICTAEECVAVIGSKSKEARAAERILSSDLSERARISKNILKVSDRDGNVEEMVYIVHITYRNGTGNLRNLGPSASGFVGAVCDASGAITAVHFLGVAYHACKSATTYKVAFAQPGLGQRIFTGKSFELP